MEPRLEALRKVLRYQGSHLPGLGPIAISGFLDSMFVGSSSGIRAPTIAERPFHPILLTLPSRGCRLVRSNPADGLGGRIDDKEAGERNLPASMSRDFETQVY